MLWHCLLFPLFLKSRKIRTMLKFYHLPLRRSRNLYTTRLTEGSQISSVITKPVAIAKIIERTNILFFNLWNINRNLKNKIIKGFNLAEPELAGPCWSPRSCRLKWNNRFNIYMPVFLYFSKSGSELVKYILLLWPLAHAKERDKFFSGSGAPAHQPKRLRLQPQRNHKTKGSNSWQMVQFQLQTSMVQLKKNVRNKWNNSRLESQQIVFSASAPSFFSSGPGSGSKEPTLPGSNRLRLPSPEINVFEQ